MVLSIKDLNISYGEKQIIKDVSFDVEKGQFLSILGRNGCGKSSMVKAISQNTDYEGKILFYNKEIQKYKKKEIAKELAVLMQFNDAIEDVSVREFIGYGRTPFKGIFESLNIDDMKIIDQVIEQTSLRGFEDREISTLSGGEKQRVFLAMCLAQEPDVIILDEPTNHLDIKYQLELLALIKDINVKKQTTIICVLHDLNQALKFSDEVILLNEGHIYTKGTVHECINVENIEAVFGVEAEIIQTSRGVYVDFII